MKTMLSTTTLLPRLALALLALAARGGVAEAAAGTCAAETMDLGTNAQVAAATLKLQLAAMNAFEACFEANQTSCDVTADTGVQEEAANVGDVCVAQGGQVYTPEQKWSCDNSNTGITTTVTWDYAACIGANCSTEQITEEWNAMAQNVTEAANTALSGFGVQCEASVSGAAALLRGGALLAALLSGGAALLALAA